MAPLHHDSSSKNSAAAMLCLDHLKELQDAIKSKDDLAIAVGLDSFHHVAVPALADGTLSPDQALEFLTFRNPLDDAFFFKQTGDFNDFLKSTCQAVITNIQDPARRSFVSMQALYQLADHVLDPALSTPERRAVWQALVVGCTRTIGVGNVRTEPSEVIDHLSLNIAKQLTVNSNAVISLLASICSTSTPASLAKSVDLLLEKLALGDDETIPALVKICALRTIGDCATRKDNRDAAGNPCCTTVCRVEYAGYLARTLERTALTGVIADAARQLCRLLTGEAMLILSSTQDRAASDFVKFGQGQRITRLVERATTALESTSKERGTSLEPVTIANLNLALDAAQVIDALVTAEGVTLRLSRFLPKALTPTANALISRICLKLMAGKPVS